jgi:IS30 family transposase
VVKLSNLTLIEREQIEYYLSLNLRKRQIAKFIGRNIAVVVREIQRHKSPYFPYNAALAQRSAERKSHKTNKRKLEKNEKLRQWVVTRLRDKWSPEQIEGRLKEYPPPELKGATITHEAIYQYIYTNDDNPLLYKYLRRSKWLRQKRGKRKYRAQIIPDRTSIHQRPEEINKREKVGHFESDTVEFRKQREVISVQYERKIQLARITKLLTKKAEDTEYALSKTLENLPRELCQSITFDNGTENVKHTTLKEIYEIKTYFCDPYSAWQKGGVENLNGLIRQYLPKKTNMQEVTENDILEIQESLNNRPRKGLGYLTPNEALNIKVMH